MSNSTGTTSFQLTGGIATSSDIAPTVILLCAYIALLPVVILRFVSPSSRTKILIRPAIFIIARIVTWSIRLYLSTHTTGSTSTVYIVEIVLISIGLVFLIEPLVALLAYLVGPYAPQEDILLNKGFRLLKVAILGSIILGIASSSMISNPDDFDTVKTLRTVSAIIACAVIAVSVIILLKAKTLGAPSRPWTYMIPIILAMTVADVFKLIQSLDHDQSSVINKKALFYLLLTLPEWIVAALFSIPNLVWLFDIDVGKEFKPVQRGREVRGHGDVMQIGPPSEEALRKPQQARYGQSFNYAPEA